MTGNRAAELAKCAPKQDVVTTLSIHAYYRSAEHLLLKAEVARSEKDEENLYIFLLRWASLVMDTIPQHPQAKSADLAERKQQVMKKLLEVLSELESLKTSINTRAAKQEEEEGRFLTGEAAARAGVHSLGLQDGGGDGGGGTRGPSRSSPHPATHQPTPPATTSSTTHLDFSYLQSSAEGNQNHPSSSSSSAPWEPPAQQSHILPRHLQLHTPAAEPGPSVHYPSLEDIKTQGPSYTSTSLPRFAESSYPDSQRIPLSANGAAVPEQFAPSAPPLDMARPSPPPAASPAPPTTAVPPTFGPVPPGYGAVSPPGVGGRGVQPQMTGAGFQHHRPGPPPQPLPPPPQPLPLPPQPIQVTSQALSLPGAPMHGPNRCSCCRPPPFWIPTPHVSTSQQQRPLLTPHLAPPPPPPHAPPSSSSSSSHQGRAPLSGAPPPLASQSTSSYPQLAPTSHARRPALMPGFKDLHVDPGMLEAFLRLAADNTARNLETCALLTGRLRGGTFSVTTLLVPKQVATSDTCDTVNEEEVFEAQEARGLQSLGWVHTHPTQTCFMSSVDLHTHAAYQTMLDEAVAIVMAPTDPDRRFGIFRLSTPNGLKMIQQCQERGFHPHTDPTDGSEVYEHSSHVYLNEQIKWDILDLR